MLGNHDLDVCTRELSRSRVTSTSRSNSLLTRLTLRGSRRAFEPAGRRHAQSEAISARRRPAQNDEADDDGGGRPRHNSGTAARFSAAGAQRAISTEHSPANTESADVERLCRERRDGLGLLVTWCFERIDESACGGVRASRPSSRASSSSSSHRSLLGRFASCLRLPVFSDPSR